jgi:hypothetical protein
MRELPAILPQSFGGGKSTFSAARDLFPTLILNSTTSRFKNLADTSRISNQELFHSGYTQVKIGRRPQ